MFCENCGSNVSEDSKFCEKCGSAITRPENIEEVAITEVQTAATGGEAIAVLAQKPVTVAGNVTKRLKNIISKKYVLIGIGVVALVVLAVILCVNVFFKSSSKLPIVYWKDNDIVMKKEIGEKEIEISDNVSDSDDISQNIEVGSGSSFMSQNVKFTSDRSRMFFLDNINQDENTADLYVANVSKLKPEGKSTGDNITKISSNVPVNSYNPYILTSDEKSIIYLKDYTSDEGGKLYISDFKESKLIDKDVDDDFRLARSGKQLLYSKINNDVEKSLYIKEISSDKDGEKIDSKVDRIVTHSSDLEKIYYTKAGDDASNNLALYVKEKGKDKEKLVSGFDSIVTSSDTGNFFYTKVTETKTNLYELVNDNKSQEDSGLTEPNTADFQKEESYTDSWGYTYTYPVTDYDAYDEAWNKYQDKLDRDNLRKQLKDTAITTNKYDLYLYSDGKDELVTKDYSRDGSYMFQDAYNKSILYYKEEQDKFTKPNITDISFADDVQTAYDNSKHVSKNAFMVLLGGKEFELDTKIQSVYMTDDDKKLYCIEKEEDTIESGNLAIYDIENGKIKNRKELDSDVYGGIFVYDNKVFYYKDVEENSGELYTLKDGKPKSIADDVKRWNTQDLPDDGIMLYISDYDSKSNSGTLNMLKGDEKIKIADDVNEYFYFDPTNILYLTDFETGSGGELWGYEGKDKKEQIDEDVFGVFEEYQGYRF